VLAGSAAASRAAMSRLAWWAVRAAARRYLRVRASAVRGLGGTGAGPTHQPASEGLHERPTMAE